MTGLIGELHAARDELAKMAVAEERLRFARDLHDLLGQRLSAITLRGERALPLDVVNDGVAAAPDGADAAPGSGLRNLACRVSEIGGNLHTGPEPDGRFRLGVDVPLPA